jgi:hypothetical protein
VLGHKAAVFSLQKLTVLATAGTLETSVAFVHPLNLIVLDQGGGAIYPF